ncbi:hypothetical protein QR98_0089900 [Sarcoptes scabiei]|uniref:Uncharacterized protein n=1 Tax=Sarcoptes scabiei TaxID=52283 RepID=A0A132AIM3_SARSC|nr:hypothetical protein QR98_0089900 [Sarcoptes scabiei]
MPSGSLKKFDQTDPHHQHHHLNHHLHQARENNNNNNIDGNCDKSENDRASNEAKFSTNFLLNRFRNSKNLSQKTLLNNDSNSFSNISQNDSTGGPNTNTENNSIVIECDRNRNNLDKINNRDDSIVFNIDEVSRRDEKNKSIRLSFISSTSSSSSSTATASTASSITTESSKSYIENKDDFVEKLKSIKNESSKSKPTMERGQWQGKLDFIFSCISYAVGLGNVWRAFLVPYLICIIILGIPLFLMEVSLGQYYHAGGVSIWNQIPILKGVGFASMIMIGLCNTYYIVIIAWTLFYLFNSFLHPLPWIGCDNAWNSPDCYDEFHLRSIEINNTSNVSIEMNRSHHAISPVQEFWKAKTLNISNDLADIGQIQWHLFGTLILAWILVYAVIYKGIHQSGKIIWFMAMFPYVILTILFFYGVTLPGSSNGIEFYITPKWEMLAEAKIWVAAGTQLLFTYGIGIGTNIALGSYNPTHHNFYRDSFIACLLSSFTSLFSGFVIFSVLGHMAYTMNTSVAEVARSGPGLAFIVYPEAVTRLPWPNFWAIIFFTMLLVLGIDSQFCTVESFVTGIVDEWPNFLRPKRKSFTLFVVVIHFILGISMITSGGMYVFQLMDNFSASGITLIVVVLAEVIAFAWIYGESD